MSYNTATGIVSAIGNRPVRYVPSPNTSPMAAPPSLLVMHYTGSGGINGDGDAGWFKDRASGVSAHFVIGRDGGIIQCVPLTRAAWHAGTSVWRGRAGVNAFSFGIEMDCWGKLDKRANGIFTSYNGTSIPAVSVVEAAGAYWEDYTKVQYESMRELISFLAKTFPSLVEVAGHSEVSPGRKIDPGPHFNMILARNALEGNGPSPLQNKEWSTTASGLNMRGFPSTDFDNILGVIPRATKIDMIYDGLEGWAYIEVPLDGIRKTGWVSTAYLTYN